MNIAELATAILARAQADTGSGGLYEGSAWSLINDFAYHRQAAATSRPYATFHIPSAGNESDTFTDDVALASVFMRVVVPMEDAGDGGTPLTTASDILVRLIGDASQQGDLTPTYGFHRHKLSDATTDTYTHMVLVNQSEAHDDDAEEFVFVLEFEVHVITT